jgi:superoxide dismutase
MIPHLEFGIGAFFPENGMIQISESIAKLAESLGVVIHLNAKVSGIKTENGKAIGLETEKGFWKADVVVSAVDVSQTYSKLLGMKGIGEKYLKLPKSTSAIIWYWGVKRKTEQTGLHNIFFSQFRSPRTNNVPNGPIFSTIKSNFKSWDNFKDQFVAEALKLHGSGWIYLARDGKIKTIHNHQLRTDILILVDMWEHAYISDYGSNKEKYINSIWKIFDWNAINSRWGKAYK